jgi:hypothetical protein
MVLERTTLLLRFGTCIVGEIEDAFWSDDTGYGVFRLAAGNNSDPTLQRLREYIAFSEEWHARLRAEQPHSASEWDQFRDVYESGLWNTVGPDGAVNRIGGPVFVEGEVTWRPA